MSNGYERWHKMSGSPPDLMSLTVSAAIPLAAPRSAVRPSDRRACRHARRLAGGHPAVDGCGSDLASGREGPADVPGFEIDDKHGAQLLGGDAALIVGMLISLTSLCPGV